MNDISRTRDGDLIPLRLFISVLSARLQETLSSKREAVGVLKLVY